MDKDLLTSQPTAEPELSARDLLRPTPARPSLLKLDEVAGVLRCTRRSLERQTAAQRIAVVHIGRSVRIEPAELDAYLDRLRLEELQASHSHEPHGQTA